MGNMCLAGLKQTTIFAVEQFFFFFAERKKNDGYNCLAAAIVVFLCGSATCSCNSAMGFYARAFGCVYEAFAVFFILSPSSSGQFSTFL